MGKVGAANHVNLDRVARLNQWSHRAAWRNRGAIYTVGCPARALADAFTDLSNNAWVGSMSVADVDLMLAERRL